MAILSAQDIQCDYPYTIGTDTAKKRIKIMDNQTNQPNLIVEFFNNRFYLSANFTNHAALRTLNNRRLVFCHVIEFKDDYEEKRLIRLMSMAFLERGVPWKLRYELIQKLRSEYDLSEVTLANSTGIAKNEIQKYIIEPGVPDDFKEMAIEKGHSGPLLNKIYQDNYFSDEAKNILYGLAFKGRPRLTIEKFSSLKRFIAKGFYLTPNIIELTEQVIKIIEPREFIESVYWGKISRDYSP
jgi:hypothetical protein